MRHELQRRLFRPLGLRPTSFPIGPRIGGRHAHGYLSIALESPDRQREVVALVNAMTFAEKPGDDAAQAA
jgi:CubicO group peptidase (beta-lactamase class C family)